jgi:hypothetical protein
MRESIYGFAESEFKQLILSGNHREDRSRSTIDHFQNNFVNLHVKIHINYPCH